MTRIAVRPGLDRIVTTGIVAGLIFAAFEVVAAALTMGPDAAMMPLRMIGAILLGPEALDPGYSLVTAALTGVVVHMILSITFAGIFAAVAPVIMAGFPTTPGTLTVVGLFFGAALWLVNFYAIAPLAGWTWFPDRSDPMVQFLAHTFFFGGPVGWLFGRAMPRFAE